jgi:hypothetical protein
MKLIMTILVRDEEDIIATNIEYHLAQGVDFIIATDNLSVDSTSDVLAYYQEHGVLHVLDETEDDYSQHRWVTRMARMAYTDLSADWVINNDADEFWWPESAETLKTILETVPANVPAVSAERKNFLPCMETEQTYFIDTMTVRDVNSPLPSKICHRAYPDIEVKQGNHGVLRNQKVLPATKVPISIFHFPLRTYSQFENKIAKGGAAYARNTSLHKGIGHTWRLLYNEYLKGELYDYFNEQILSKQEIEQGLKEGKFVSDHRLREFVNLKLDRASILGLSARH